jgi:hypothetical protein
MWILYLQQFAKWSDHEIGARKLRMLRDQTNDTNSRSKQSAERTAFDLIIKQILRLSSTRKLQASDNSSLPWGPPNLTLNFTTVEFLSCVDLKI